MRMKAQANTLMAIESLLLMRGVSVHQLLVVEAIPQEADE
jgi:hypothetical protein